MSKTSRGEKIPPESSINHWAFLFAILINMENKERPKVGIGSLIVREGKILIGKRLDSHGAGTYMIPGGHLEYGETFEQCAVREATEECGLKDLKVVGLVSVGNDIEYGKHYISIGILLESNVGESYNAEPEKATEWAWYDPKELPDNMFPHSLKVIKNYLAKKIYTDNL